MKYRREIDGLRALAVIPVILFHAGFELFSGGFVGVDIFFVISGYLITTVILSGYMAGTFSFADFYEKRARRILPAIFLIMFVCIPFAWFLLLPDDLERFSKSVIATTLYVSNILFFKESGYFDTTAEFKPLLHTWSLGVEEQFYIIFPLLLGIVWRFCKLKTMQVVLLVMGIVSLVIAHMTVYDRPDAAFFLLHTRAWELLIGSMAGIYFLNSEYKMPKAIKRKNLSLVGIALIVASIIFYDDTTPFPSLYTLAPTVGALLIILYAQPDTWVGRFLGSKILVGLGLVSYSSYLWHQPLFVFARHYSLEEPSHWVFLVLSLMTIVLAYFTWKYVEQPFRRKDFLSRRKVFVLSMSVSLFFIAIGIIGLETGGLKFRYKNNNVKGTNSDSIEFRKHCVENPNLPEGIVDFCILGDREVKTKPQLAVFGDSHSEAMLPLFDKIAKGKNISFAYMGLGGCPPLLDVDVYKGNYPRGTCLDLGQGQYNYVANNGIKTIFLIARWGLYTSGTYNEKMKKYFLVQNHNDHLSQSQSRKNFVLSVRETFSAYKDIGVNVYIVFQIPEQRVNPKYLYVDLQGISDPFLKIKRHSIKTSEHLKLQAFNRGVLEKYADQYENVTLINLDDFFCDLDVCLIGDVKQSYYKDDDHINTYGVSVIFESIERYID